MFFNGFTLLLMIIAGFVGFLGGIKYENNYMRSRFNKWTNGLTIEEQMEKDGWHVWLTT